jgi:hypothetical protein
MGHHEADGAWGLENVALQEAPGRPEVLARFPDVGPVESNRQPQARAARSDGRILSPALATKLLVGGVVLLVLVAILPFVFSNKNEPKPGTPPAPNADEAPMWKGVSSKTPNTLPPSAKASYEPTMSINPDLPPTPDFIGTPQSSSPNPPPQAPRAESRKQAEAAGIQQPTPGVTEQTQTDLGPLRARANQMMTIGDPTPTPAGVYVDDDRLYQADSRANLPARYPIYASPYRAVEPGVARLEGIIEKPSVRTTYDAARSRVY